VAGKLSIQPGRTLFIRTLSAANWSAKIFVKAASPARNTAEVGNIGLGPNAHAVEILMMTPASWRTAPAIRYFSTIIVKEHPTDHPSRLTASFDPLMNGTSETTRLPTVPVSSPEPVAAATPQSMAKTPQCCAVVGELAATAGPWTWWIIVRDQQTDRHQHYSRQPDAPSPATCSSLTMIRVRK
jgi:hypothetical protein